MGSSETPSRKRRIAVWTLLVVATLLALVAVLFLLMVFPAIRRSRQEALAE